MFNYLGFCKTVESAPYCPFREEGLFSEFFLGHTSLLLQNLVHEFGARWLLFKHLSYV